MILIFFVVRPKAEGFYSDVEDYADYPVTGKPLLGSQFLLCCDFVAKEVLHVKDSLKGIKAKPWEGKKLTHIEEGLDVAENVNTAILKGKYGTILIGDNVMYNGKFRKTCGKTLREFFDQGGTVILYVGVGFVNMPAIMNKMFGCSWGKFAYGLESFKITEAGRKQFNLGIDEMYESRQNMLEVKGMPQDQIMFIQIPEEDLETEAEPDQPPKDPMLHCPVAKYENKRGGRVFWFGDAYGGEEVPDLLRSLLE